MSPAARNAKNIEGKLKFLQLLLFVWVAKVLRENDVWTKQRRASRKAEGSGGDGG